MAGKSAARKPQPHPTVEEIPKDEQWRIIQESGVLKSIGRDAKPNMSQELDTLDRVFDTVLFVIPFSFLYLMMDM